MLEKGLQKSIIWIAAIICLLAGLYFALDRTFLIFTPHNYPLSPLGDDALDGVPLLYPILLGQKSIWGIFQPYADHRLVVERLFGMYDFLFNNGTQAANPVRLAFFIWLDCALFFFGALLPNKDLQIQHKLIILGVMFTLFFSGMALINYGSTLMNTWPIVIAFTLLAFITASKYCKAQLNDAPNWQQITYIVFTFLFTMLGLYTFGVSLIIWPIVLIVLYKRGCLKKHWYLWATAIAISYFAYTYDGWHAAATQIGVKNFFKGHFVALFLYFSRLVSLPILPDAPGIASLPTAVMGILTLALSFYTALFYIRRKNWSDTDSVVFCFFAYGLFTTVAISVSRFWMEFEVIQVAARFAITNFMLILSMATTCFIGINSRDGNNLYASSIASLAILVWLVALFIPGDLRMGGKLGLYQSSVWNQFLIAEATNVPIDEGFVKEISQIENQRSIPALNFLNDTQKKLGKGAYSLWMASHVDQPFDSLHFAETQCDGSFSIQKLRDFRDFKNPAVTLTAQIDKTNVTPNWDIIFTNKIGTIVGFGISNLAFVPQPDRLPISFINSMGALSTFYIANFNFNAPQLDKWWKRLVYHKYDASVAWTGALNSKLLTDDNIATAWLVNKQDKQFCKAGEITL